MHAMKEAILLELHELAGLCGHCGKRSCGGRHSQSFLPDKIPYEKVVEAIDKAVKREPGMIADLEAKLAQSQTELAELRGVHRQLVNDAQGLGKKLIEDTCG